MKRLRYILGWVLVRPRRWFFWNMISSSTPQWRSELTFDGRWHGPNIHWWILYKTVFKFFKWLNYEGWRPLCKWSPTCLIHKPWYAELVHRIGETTAGAAISGGECYHCASKEGDQVDLAYDETGTHFVDVESWTVGTQDGTDHRFSGITICPKCGFRSEYEDGSL